MQDQNRYEETPKKENIFLKIIKMFGTYLRNICYDFFTSFKYNNMKLAGLLIFLPGAIFGFFLMFHYPVAVALNFSSTTGEAYKGTPDISGLLLFLLMLFGILNMFTGFQMMGKKNLGSVVMCTITSVIMIACGTVYIYLVFTYLEGTNIYFDQLDKAMASGMSLEKARLELVNPDSEWFIIGINDQERVVFDKNYILSVGSVILCIVCSVAGCVLGFINYDRTYEKVNR